jgi:hypothetical protein
MDDKLGDFATLKPIVHVALMVLLEHGHPVARREINPRSLREFGRYVESTLAVGSLSAIAETCNLLTLANRLNGGDGPSSGLGMDISSTQRKRPRLDPA